MELNILYSKIDGTNTYKIFEHNELLILELSNTTYNDLKNITRTYYVSQIDKKYWSIFDFEKAIINENESDFSLTFNLIDLYIYFKEKTFTNIEVTTLNFNKKIEDLQKRKNNTSKLLNLLNIKNYFNLDLINLKFNLDSFQISTKIKNDLWFSSTNPEIVNKLSFITGLENNLEIPKQYLVNLHYIQTSENPTDLYKYNCVVVDFNENWTYTLNNLQILHCYLEFVNWPYVVPALQEIQNHFILN